MAEPISIIPGSTVDDRFTLVRPLGKGSMGSVWLARHLALDIDVAIKFIDSALTKEVNYVERFQREARAAAQLKSPHVVQVLDYGTCQRGRPFMAMEYLEGMTLGALLEERGRLDLESTARIVTHASRGLGKAHAVGIVHRDIKPENLFLCADNDEDGLVLKVLDFGVARAGFSSSGQGTLAGQLVGSPLFMSPEQARGYRTIDHRADLFSLAVVVYQCLTGALPFNGEGLGEVLVSICTSQAIPPSQLTDGIPAAVDAWFEKALSKKAFDRFDSAREMSITLAEAMGINATSGVDVTASYSRLSLSDVPGASSLGTATARSAAMKRYAAVEPPATIVRSAANAPSQNLEMTRVARPHVPKGPPHSSALAASRIQPTSIADALSPLTSVPHTLGVALLDHNDNCLLIRGASREAATYTAIAQHARTVAGTVESIEGVAEPTHLSVRFESATVYVRWVGTFTFVALGDSQMRALLLTVGSNRLAERLAAFTEQLGGVEPVANLLRDSGIGLPVVETQKSAPLGKHQVSAAPPAEEVLRAPQPLVEDIKLPMLSFWGFSKEKKPSSPPPKRTPTMPRSPIALRAAEQQSTGLRPPPDPPTRQAEPAKPPPAPSTRAKTEAQLSASPTKKQRVQIYRGHVIGAAPPEETKPKKKVRLYRGRVIDEE